MTRKITVELTEVEYKAMSIIANDPQEWLAIFTKNRAKKAIDEIAAQIVEEKLTNGEPIFGTKEDLVLAANIPTAKEVNEQNDHDNP